MLIKKKYSNGKKYYVNNNVPTNDRPYVQQPDLKILNAMNSKQKYPGLTNFEKV